APSVYFVSQDHLGDMDRYNDLLDIFDVIRLARHEAWGEPLQAGALLRRQGVGTLEDAVARLVDAPLQFDHDDATARITLGAGSTITIPREWHERLTDLTISGPNAEALMYAHVSMAALSRRPPDVSKEDATCAIVGEVKINNVFYRTEPQA